ncbi:MAG: hypothetical protein HYR91_07800 [Flavobacteriia bacterium]|nr:hypothetical protein [Flavobacteriia bacterium]
MKNILQISLSSILLIFLLGNNENSNASNSENFFKQIYHSDKQHKLEFHPKIDYTLLNDQLHDYIKSSYISGIGIIKKTKEINPFFNKGNLILLKNTESYFVDTMEYSYPFLIPKAYTLLNEIGDKFQLKLKRTKYKNVKFYITSALRTLSSVKRLRKHNRNASKYSAHMHGTTFDLGYDEFYCKRSLNKKEVEYLKSILASILIDLKKEKKCWVTYEVNQTCFHIVSR